MIYTPTFYRNKVLYLNNNFSGTMKKSKVLCIYLATAILHHLTQVKIYVLHEKKKKKREQYWFRNGKVSILQSKGRQYIRLL